MPNYTKDRNIIRISLDGVNGEYTLDINTGVYCGVKGTPIKTCPQKNTVRNMFCRWNNEDTNLGRVITLMLDGSKSTANFPNFVEQLQSADKVDAIGLPCAYLYADQYVYLAKNIKFLAAYLKEHTNAQFQFYAFQKTCEYAKAINKLGSLANTLNEEMFHALNHSRDDLTIEELGVCAYYLGRGKYWEYHNHNIDTLVRYIEVCRLLEKEPQKVNNFMREYCETIKEYELRKTEFDNKAIALNYARHSKAWEFEYGDFKIFIPTTAQDIINEGRNMHHCVGSYVNNVVDGNTYICFVRRKDTPNECYITCQVYTDGSIGQYFLAYDRYIRTDEDREFKEHFQEHLTAVWG